MDPDGCLIGRAPDSQNCEKARKGAPTPTAGTPNEVYLAVAEGVAKWIFLVLKVHLMVELQPLLRPNTKPDFVVRVDLDARAYLFPAGKSVSQLSLLTDGRLVHFDAVFPFNE